MLAAQTQMSDVTLQPSTEQEDWEEEVEQEDEDGDEEEDEEWTWRSAGGALTKRYNRTSLNCQVRHTEQT